MGPEAGQPGGLAVSVHGPAGVLDLVVPPAATLADVAHEYAAHTGLGSPPTLYGAGGSRLPADAPLAAAGVGPGALLVALDVVGDRRPEPPDGPATEAAADPGAGRSGWPHAWAAGWGSAACALLAGWLAAVAGPGAVRTTVLVLLVATAVLGVLPGLRAASVRAATAPAFGGAAAFVVAFDPALQPVSAQLPLAVGSAALGAAATAALARSLVAEAEEALRVWLAAGVAVFVVPLLASYLGLTPQVAWAVLLIAAVLAARIVPGLAVDVPDHLLLDLDRLAVSAWSAREQPRSRRGRLVASLPEVEAVVTRGARLVAAATAAVAVVAAGSSVLLLHAVESDVDRRGALALVGFAGAALVLAGRSHRHPAARALLRTGGLACLALLAGTALWTQAPSPAGLAVMAPLVAVPVLVAAVATGRGWRSAWWARRAEVAEALCGAAAVASLVVATGLFRVVWQAASRIG
ncbi:hypothetical protein ACFP3Q_06415 [Nocardioides sp. GCM10027113]|uniref:hypothetical protein n=1 Tax=unclassified Nocardioides TaxID=2615069 RepID=UPI003611663A